MISDITPERIANSILLEISFTGVFLLVEGQSDNLLFGKFVDSKNCEIVIAFGSNNVIEVVKLLNDRGFKNKLGIIDSDFRNLTEEFPETDNILTTDFHDIEIAIFQSPAFHTVLHSYYQKEKCKTFEKKCGKDIREILLQLAKPIGYLRFINSIYKLGLIFKPRLPDGRPLKYVDFIDHRKLEYSGDKKMIQTVLNYTVNKTEANLPSLDEVETLLENEIKNDFDLHQICNGHDLVNIISISLRRKIGNKNAGECKVDQLAKELILAYDSEYFKTSELYAHIKDWEKHNTEFLTV